MNLSDKWNDQADIVSILSKNEIPYQKYQDAENNSLYDYI
ncbi:hypothetical protein HNQ56_001200 [Anaerotaenia torta]